jgi:hypothetical protein
MTGEAIGDFRPRAEAGELAKEYKAHGWMSQMTSRSIDWNNSEGIHNLFQLPIVCFIAEQARVL